VKAPIYMIFKLTIATRHYQNPYMKVIEKQLEIKETENFNSKISINLNSIYLPLENRILLREDNRKKGIANKA
jgi:hypothetical protein